MADEQLEIDFSEEPTAPPPEIPDSVLIDEAPEKVDKPPSEPVKAQEKRETKQKERDYKTEYENLQAALREERNKNREQLSVFDGLKTELEQYRSERSKVEKQQEFDTDPITTLQKEIEDLKHEKQTRAQREEQAKKEAEQQESIRAFVVKSREEFERETPDYQKAYAYLADKRTKEFMAVGFKDQYTLNQALEMEMQRLVNHAIGIGENPARLVYNLAVANGYSAEPGETMEKNDQAEALKRISEGQKAASNSGRGSTASKNGAVRLSDIENMSADEFEQVWNKLKRQGRLG